MSQTIEEMLEAWETSRAEIRETELPLRFYDVRKRPSPTRKRVGRFSGITPEGEALWAKREGLDRKIAKEPKA